MRPVKEISFDMKQESFLREISFLFIIDVSGSMEVHNKTLSENLKLVLEPLFLNYSHYNYNFAFTSMSPYTDLPEKYQPLQTQLSFDSCPMDASLFTRSVNLGSYFNYSSDDIKAYKDDIICLLSKNITEAKGNMGTEPYFESLSYIIEQADEKFKRVFFGEDKLLVLFFISDAWGQDDGDYTDQIKKFFGNRKRAAEEIAKSKFNLIQSLMGSGLDNIRIYATVNDDKRKDKCGDIEKTGDTPENYPFHLYELIKKTGGLRVSICDSQWGNQLTDVFDDLKKAFYSLSFELSEVPKGDSIEVYMNDKEIPRDFKKGWSLNLEILSIEIGGEFDTFPYLKDTSDCEKRETSDQAESDSCKNKIKIRYNPLNIELLNRSAI